MEHQESLESSASICHFPDPVHNKVHDLLANGVEAPGVIVGGVLLTTDHLLGVEQLSVGSSPDLVNNGGFQVKEDRSRNMFTRSSLREEGGETVICSSSSLVTWKLAI